MYRVVTGRYIDPRARARHASCCSSPAEETKNSCREVSLLASHQGDPGSIPGRVTPDFRMWESCQTMPLASRYSRGSPVSPPFSIITSITLIGSQDLDDKSRPNLFTHSLYSTDLGGWDFSDCTDSPALETPPIYHLLLSSQSAPAFPIPAYMPLYHLLLTSHSTPSTPTLDSPPLHHLLLTLRVILLPQPLQLATAPSVPHFSECSISPALESISLLHLLLTSQMLQLPPALYFHHSPFCSSFLRNLRISEDGVELRVWSNAAYRDSSKHMFEFSPPCPFFFYPSPVAVPPHTTIRCSRQSGETHRWCSGDLGQRGESVELSGGGE
ncbi:hypothetical protein PR048_032896 [Dryococelus australis]|uniref:Uncharacterized protein n=1 Tax=Dryococelus australis TaxID=614101 RepID=A0ABQ9G3I9_9NEOP|nr:hypothetical protein PR048_032896 [Dryococelus australis]